MDNYLKTHCENESFIYNLNRKRSLLNYRNSLSNLFCVTFDNSSDKGKFYTNVNDLDETKVMLIFNNYIQNDFLKNYYSSILSTGLILNKDRYDLEDYIRIHYNNSNPYVLEGKFFIEGTGSSGECIKSRPVKFMINNDPIICGKKIVFIFYEYFN